MERRTIAHGEEHFERAVAVHPGAVAVLVINENDQVGFIRQYRATFDEEILEIPAGTLGRSRRRAPRRGQTRTPRRDGVARASWTFLGRFMNSPGWSTQVMWVYEARELEEVDREPAGAEESSATIHWYAKDEIQSILRSAFAIDSTTTIALHRLFGSFLDDV